MLDGKIAVIYGSGGAVGGAVAEAFARHGARVVLAGRTQAKLERVACRIWDKGGHAAAMPVDALDADAVERHMEAIVERFGRIDISFNLIDVGDIQGTPLVDMPVGSFAQPINRAMHTHFLTATAAARRMMSQRSGVILALTAQCGRNPSPTTGGFGVACAAIEALCRQLAAELGPHNIRVACIRSAGSPDAPGLSDLFDEHAAKEGIAREELDARYGASTMLGRLPRLAEVGNAAVLLASEYAGSVTAEIFNLTAGQLAD
ncbi:NADP-dependent 3-hydroxy acid dehydrogenase YdfG [Kaistia soli DSM 19436]|uniref:NADP-dependent 3-hydroxy acid dehydrogenase YdfG n=1 Tax=Kaistia soli DSM 19436 TaxID=1122133 RepID=A0A1M4Z235_9HYPH|nr:SDR family oxidoreductase [Kaistia soli]SHF12025.1 NADP-dependent 3-hydroxy acid dehydrogenase YdfG [Kaistia soli DSM 19436]